MSSPEGVVIRRDEPLARHTAWRTGGPCEAWIVVHRAEALGEALAWCRAQDLSWTPLGAGTRTVVREQGLAGAVLRLGTGFAGVQIEGEELTAGAGAPLPAVVQAAAQAGLSGLEAMAAVPGSLGASLLLDEGWDDRVVAVRYLARGREQQGSLPEARAGRRNLVLGATLRLRASDPNRVLTESRARLRGEGGGLYVPPHSWYTPPRKASLRDVLERAGLLDVRLREVSIPATAPELLVNLGGGTARDLALLHQSAIERVRRSCGVDLASRVRWAGRPGRT